CRRGRARARAARRARGERRRRGRSRRAAARTRAGGRTRVTHRRYGDPLPLGEPGGLPYSKGLMARALIAAGVSAERAYKVARRVEIDLVDRDEQSLEFDRFEEIAAQVLGEEEGRTAAGRLRRYAA